jgi:hypothetical protein
VSVFRVTLCEINLPGAANEVLCEWIITDVPALTKVLERGRANGHDEVLDPSWWLA